MNNTTNTSIIPMISGERITENPFPLPSPSPIPKLASGTKIQPRSSHKKKRSGVQA